MEITDGSGVTSEQGLRDRRRNERETRYGKRRAGEGVGEGQRKGSVPHFETDGIYTTQEYVGMCHRKGNLGHTHADLAAKFGSESDRINAEVS